MPTATALPSACRFLLSVTALWPLLGQASADEPPPPGTPPAKPFNLVLRSRVPVAGGFEAKERPQPWDPRKSALIVCDVWDLHHCKRAVERVQEMAPRMNEVLTKARQQGAFIIHAPSDCMAFYEGTPMRRRAQ